MARGAVTESHPRRREGDAPWFLRSWVAMWALTLAPMLFVVLAGFDIGKFYQLWIDGWQGIVAAMGVGMGAKMGKDALIGREAVKRGRRPDDAVPQSD